MYKNKTFSLGVGWIALLWYNIGKDLGILTNTPCREACISDK